MATIGKLVYQIETNADLKGMVATKAELREGKKLFTETRTEAERFGSKLEQIDRLAAKGAIDIDTHSRAVAKLRGEFDKTSGLNKDLLGTGNMLAQQVPGVSSFTGALGTIGPIGAAATVGLFGLNAIADTISSTFRGTAQAVGEAMERIDDTRDMAIRIGISTEALSGFRQAAGLAGVSAGEFDNDLEKMLKNVGEAAVKGGEAAEKFERIGLDVNKLANQKPERTFLEIADAIAAIEDPYLRAKTAQDIFGKSGQALNTSLMDGSNAFRDAVAEARLFGTAIDDIDSKAVADANDEIGKLKLVAEGAANSLAVELAPALGEISKETTQLVKDFGGVQGAVRDFVHFAKQEIDTFVEAIKLAHPELDLLAKGLEKIAGLTEEDRKRSRELDSKVKEQQNKNREFMEPQNETPRSGITPKDKEAEKEREKRDKEAAKLREQIDRDRTVPEGMSDTVRNLIEQRRKEAEKKLEQLLGGSDATPETKREPPPTSPFWSAAAEEADQKAAAEVAPKALTDHNALAAKAEADRQAERIREARERLAGMSDAERIKAEAESAKRRAGFTGDTDADKAQRDLEKVRAARDKTKADELRDAAEAARQRFGIAPDAERASRAKEAIDRERAAESDPAAKLRQEVDRIKEGLGNVTIDPERALRDLDKVRAARDQEPPNTLADAKEALQRNLANQPDESLEKAKEGIKEVEDEKAKLAEPVKIPIEMADPSGTPADDAIAGLRDKLKELTEEDPTARELGKLARQGASPQQLEEAKSILEQIDADKKAKKQADDDAKAFEKDVQEGQRLLDQAERRKKQLREFADRNLEKDDPDKKLQKNIAELDEAERKGVISPEERNKLDEQFRNERDKELATQQKRITPPADNRAARRGSAEAFDLINKAAQAGLSSNKNPNKKVEDNTAKTASAAEGVKDAIKDLTEKLGRPPVGVSF